MSKQRGELVPMLRTDFVHAKCGLVHNLLRLNKNGYTYSTGSAHTLGTIGFPGFISR